MSSEFPSGTHAATQALPMAGAGSCNGCGDCQCGGNQPVAQLGASGDAVVKSQTSGGSSESLLDSPEHVLSTLDSDGSRRWMYPKLITGQLWHRRRIVAYLLIAIFVAIPHIRIGGKPFILIDIPARQFTLFGHTFLPTDTLLLALGMVALFLTIMLATAISGRLWCGWGCPQTVYMEYLFRPIDRWFEGTRGKGGRPKRDLATPMRVLRWGIYLILSMLLAHTFLAYFVGTEKLSMWIRSSPIQHPAAFLLMAGTTIAMLFDFLFFREQLCLIACPYGRFQSVMLDRRSRIVGYDVSRGEPRGKGKRETRENRTSGMGDCVDCNQCVVVCPTGIDIRNGLQMECINCTQCIDACNQVMDRVGLPKGLIRYTSQDELDGKPGGILRARTVLYPLALVGVLTAFGFVLSTTSTFDALVVPQPGSTFQRDNTGMLINVLRLRLANRTDSPHAYSVSAGEPEGIQVEIVDPSMLEMDAGAVQNVPVIVKFPPGLIPRKGSRTATMVISDGAGNSREIEFRLRGPQR